jgi:kynureninase
VTQAIRNQRKPDVLSSGPVPEDVSIRFDKVYKAFGTKKVLNGLSLDVKRGEALILMGPSGTGKSVTLRHAIGLLTQDSGDVWVEGHDMARITAAARAQGIVVGWDLAHAMGNVPLSLHDWDVDFAAWCSYKYLNAGPGGTAGLFVHQRHHHADLPRLAGWWGHNKESRFKMGPGFDPIPSAEGWQVSNAPVLSMAAQRASLDLFDRMDLAQHRVKGLDLSRRCMEMLEALAEELNEPIRLLTPREDASRGCQVSVQFSARDRRFFDQLVERGVVADWREPGTIRMAFIPFYSSYEDLARLEQILRQTLSS